MRTTTDRFNLELAPRTTVPLEAARGVVIRVALGMVWITEEHETGDHVLHVGESYQVKQGGRVVVEAMSMARVIVESPTPVPVVTARRFGHFAQQIIQRIRGRAPHDNLGWSA